MPIIHFLNVKDGDCSVIEHVSSNVTVIDVCNAKPTGPQAPFLETLSAVLSQGDKGVGGNFKQKLHPVNPMQYLHQHGIRSIFRYIQTHPDMDHMDGIRALFNEFRPVNFWDTDNKKELAGSSWRGSPYTEDDWKFYRRLRETKPQANPKRLALMSGANGQYYNRSKDGSVGGDGLAVLAPTRELVDAANAADDSYNDSSYVLLYRTGGSRIVFGGDSHDDTWDHILATHRRAVTNIDVLIAPHHGRDSGRSYEFLDVLNPTLTFFGNARSEHLAYHAWNRRGLSFVTNNQANCMVVDAGRSPMELYVTHENFARSVNPSTRYDSRLRAWYVAPITRQS